MPKTKTKKRSLCCLPTSFENSVHMDPHHLQRSYQIVRRANRAGRFLTFIFLNASLLFQFSATIGASGGQLICVMLDSIFC